jgi:hypothetical protein
MIFAFQKKQIAQDMQKASQGLQGGLSFLSVCFAFKKNVSLI